MEFRISVEGRKLQHYPLGSLRYDMSKLLAKGLVKEVARSRRYRLTRQGYSMCGVFLKLFERIYAPLIAGFLQSVPGEIILQQQQHGPNSTASTNASDDLDKLFAKSRS